MADNVVASFTARNTARAMDLPFAWSNQGRTRNAVFMVRPVASYVAAVSGTIRGSA